MKRRSFLHSLSHLSASPFIIPNSLFGGYFSSLSSLSNTLSKGKILILIKLDGGNDGLNTIIPFDQYSNLNKVRKSVILPDNSIIDLGGSNLGLHPELSAFKKLYKEGRFKVIQNVGYNNPNYSHFHSMDVWESSSFSENEYGGEGNNVNTVNTGWIGRYLEDLHPGYPYDYPNFNFPHPLAVEFGYNSSFLFTGNRSVTNSVTISPQDFYRIFKDIQKEYPETPEGNKLKYLQLVINHSNSYGEVLKEFYEKGNIKYSFSPSNLSNQMESVTKLITGGLNTRVYQVSLSGFDTHSEQVDPNDTTQGMHANLLRQLNESIEKLFQNLDETGDSDRVLVMTYSEFGRTVISSDSYGTDHGDVAPMFFFGNKVDSTILGSNPIIPPDADWTYALKKEFNFQNIYYSVIKQWLGGNEDTAENVLFKKFDQLPIIQAKYIDTDGDGVSDDRDLCNTTPLGAMVNTDGCEIFSLPADNYSIQTNGVSCSGKTNGIISISVSNTEHIYNLSIPETEGLYNLNTENEHQLVIDELEIGSYTLNFTVEGQDGYLQTFEIGITEPPALSAKSSVNQKGKTMTMKLSGSDLYYAEVNGERRSYKIDNFTLQLRPGMNTVKISTPQECQGIHVEQVFISEQVKHYPNPVQGELNLVIPGEDRETTIAIYNRSGSLIKRYQEQIPFSRILKLNTTDFRSDIYVVKVNGQTVEQTFKMIKR
jgi:uncharacterized protein (DUF1501 family)